MPDAMTTPDLAERLADAARRAVLNQRPILQHDPSSVKSVVVELAVDRAGVLRESEAYICRRVTTASVLGVKG
jgi:hypothetical protein